MSEKIVKDLLLSDVFPNPDQPRKHFDETKLQELAMSIREYDVQQPIKVVPRAGRHMIIMGERRYRASLLAGKKTIPVIIEHLSDEKVLELALLENIQREDMNIIEEAKAFQGLLDRGWTRETLAEKMGFKQAWRIDERLSLLKLSPEYQDMVIKGALLSSQTGTASHALGTWALGGTNHGLDLASCPGCHVSTTSKATTYAAITTGSGWCSKCHNGQGGDSAGMVDPAQ
jgi:ParB/RepB/Spo0J family partition protein